MAFSHLAGITTFGAADEVVDWFATFEPWAVGIGWTVISGGGTTNLVLRSVSEAGGLTMLFLHIYRDGGDPSHVRIEVMDDAIGTHETDEQGYLESLDNRFPFWMSGDMDAIVVCWKSGFLYHTIYAGLVLPFALAVPDETYRMIATSRQIRGSILRDSGGVWDVNSEMYDHSGMDNVLKDGLDDTFPLDTTYFGRQADVAGQLKHVSGVIPVESVMVPDILTSQVPGGSSTWIVLADRFKNRYAMQTGGDLPTAFPPDPGTFVAAAGVAANYAALFGALAAHLTGLGWVDLGVPAVPGIASGRYFSSVGESNVDEIYIGFYYLTPVIDTFYVFTQDDAAGTHRDAHPTHRYLDAPADFPAPYWICGDRDFCIIVFQHGADYSMLVAGLVPSFTPLLLPPRAPLTPYSLYAGAMGESPGGLDPLGLILRDHNGNWNETVVFLADPNESDLSSPNNFDGTTYILWPMLLYDAIDTTLLGQLRYVGKVAGGGVANLDTITIGAEVYTVFHTFAGNNFTVRTA